MVKVQLLFALGTAAVPPGSHLPAALREEVQPEIQHAAVLGFDPDSLHVATTRSFPPGSFLGRFNGFFSTCGIYGRAQ
jgi:hypothetical protein